MKMCLLTLAWRFLVANIITVCSSCVFLPLAILFELVKNPFSNPFKVNPAIEPPSRLSDPKYGTHKFIKANGIKLHYVESGELQKPLILFMHGFPEFWYSWRHQIAHFNKNYRCVAVDMRGYGDSEKPEGKKSYKIEILVEDIRDLIRQLGVEKCILVSHDWGGIVACKFRDTYPDVTRGLVMLASTSLEAWFYQIWNSFEQRFHSAYVFMFRAPIIPELLLRLGNLSVFKDYMYVEGNDAVQEQDIECFRYCYKDKNSFTAPLNYYRANFTYTPQEQFHDEKVPFLIALAENDDALSHTLLDILKRDYAHIETKIIKASRHFVQQEKPTETNNIIESFLNKHNL